MIEDVTELVRGDGYVVAPGVLAPDEVAGLRDGVEAAVLAAVERVASAAPERVTSWINAQGHLLQNVRGTALHSTSVHWEPGERVVRNLRPVSDLDPRLDALWTDPRLTGPSADLLGVDAVGPLTSKVSVKRAEVGSEFVWHTDQDFLTPFLGARAAGEVVTAMIALDDADADNGALWVVPGSQRGETGADPVRLDVAAGSVAFFPTPMVHYSGANRSPRDRRALLYLFQPAGRPHLDETPR